MDRVDLQRLFSACDVNKSGRIEYEDFVEVCGELRIPDAQIDALFSRFDVDQDGSIDFEDFFARYDEVSQHLDMIALGAAAQTPHDRAFSAWEEFEARIEGGAVFLGRSQEQLAELYQQIHSLEDFSLLEQYETLVSALVRERKDHVLESQQLEGSLRRMEEMAARQLAEMEDDLQQQLTLVERNVREEEQWKLQTTIAAIQRRKETEMADLQAAIEKLIKYQEESYNNDLDQDAHHLKSQVDKLTQEKEHLQSSLSKAQMNISFLQVELDKLKNEYANQRLQEEWENENLKAILSESHNYSNHISVLQEMNKKLYDSNDDLRSALENVRTNNRKLSPKMDKSRRRLPIRQSTLKNLSFIDEVELSTTDSRERYSHVANWADKYLDSGVSLTVDPTTSSDGEYSSDGQDSAETVYHSYSYVPSDVETSDIKSEAAVSVVTSQGSSVGLSIRRRLSAFHSKQVGADVDSFEGPAPVYRLVLAGDAGSGKSSFLLRLTKNEFRDDIPTTLGVDFQMKKMLVNGEKTNLQIWDTAGQERFRSIARSYFRKAHGVLLLYDVTSEISFLSVREWMDQIWESTDKPLPMCLVGNKVDLRTEKVASNCVSAAHGEKLAKTYNALFCETSAKEGTNVVEAVLHLAREVKKHAGVKQKSEPQVKLSMADGKKVLQSCCRA